MAGSASNRQRSQTAGISSDASAGSSFMSRMARPASADTTKHASFGTDCWAVSRSTCSTPPSNGRGLCLSGMSSEGCGAGAASVSKAVAERMGLAGAPPSVLIEAWPARSCVWKNGSASKVSASVRRRMRIWAVSAMSSILSAVKGLPASFRRVRACARLMASKPQPNDCRHTSSNCGFSATMRARRTSRLPGFQERGSRGGSAQGSAQAAAQGSAARASSRPKGESTAKPTSTSTRSMPWSKAGSAW